jgi:protein-tyrosine phosphatase
VRPRHYNPAIDILFVCTGNMCRSPMAEVMLRRRLEERGIDAQVRSAGLTGTGSAAAEPAVQAMREFGLDLAAHESRMLSAPMVECSDLVIGLAREHVREVVLVGPGAFGRTFTLKELVRRGHDLGCRNSDESVADWLSRLNAGRSRVAHLGDSAADDVDDPIGRRAAVYERVADELSELVDQLVELAWPMDDEISPPDSSELATT